MNLSRSAKHVHLFNSRNNDKNLFLLATEKRLPSVEQRFVSLIILFVVLKLLQDSQQPMYRVMLQSRLPVYAEQKV